MDCGRFVLGASVGCAVVVGAAVGAMVVVIAGGVVVVLAGTIVVEGAGVVRTTFCVGVRDGRCLRVIVIVSVIEPLSDRVFVRLRPFGPPYLTPGLR